MSREIINQTYIIRYFSRDKIGDRPHKSQKILLKIIEIELSEQENDNLLSFPN